MLCGWLLSLNFAFAAKRIWCGIANTESCRITEGVANIYWWAQQCVFILGICLCCRCFTQLPSGMSLEIANTTYLSFGYVYHIHIVRITLKSCIKKYHWKWGRKGRGRVRQDEAFFCLSHGSVGSENKLLQSVECCAIAIALIYQSIPRFSHPPPSPLSPTPLPRGVKDWIASCFFFL